MNLFDKASIRFAAWLRLGFCLLLVAGVLLGVPPRPAAAAQTFTVNTATDLVDYDPGDGRCDAVPNAPYVPAGDQCTLRAAIMETNAVQGADVIVLPAGKYVLTRPGVDESDSLTGSLDIMDALVIQGAGRTKSVVDGGGLDRVFQIGSSDDFKVDIKNITIQHGKTSRGGGALFNYGPDLTLTNVNIINNEARDGGGILATKGSIKLVNSLVQGNAAKAEGDSSYGGGLKLYAGVSAFLTTTTVQNNTSGYAGGIHNEGPLTVSGSTISGNIAGVGAGILTNGTLTMSNSTISGNKATRYSSSYGGGILFESLAFGSALTHVTITANETSTNGGGVHIESDLVEPSFHGSIIAGNKAATGPDCYGAVRMNGFNLWGDSTYCEMVGGQPGAPDLIDVKPRLDSLKLNGGPTRTHALLADSPAIDAAGPVASGACAATDQRGGKRAIDGNMDGTIGCDIGAYEYNGPIVSSIAPTTKPAGSVAFILTVTGKKFTAKSQVQWNGQPRVTQFVNSTTLKAQITVDDVKVAKKAGVRVVTVGATLDSGISNTKAFTITP